MVYRSVVLLMVLKVVVNVIGATTTPTCGE